MKFIQTFLFLHAFASGSLIRPRLGTSAISESCVTRYATTPVYRVKTTTVTSTHVSVGTHSITLTPTTTLTPSKTCTTVVTTSATTVTSTAALSIATTSVGVTKTSTVTKTLTSTSHKTETCTDTVTKTVTTSTTTVGTVSGFTPMASVPSVVDNGGAYGMDGLVVADSTENFPSNVVCYRNVVVTSFTTHTAFATHTATVIASSQEVDTVYSTKFRTTTALITPAATTLTAEGSTGHTTIDVFTTETTTATTYPVVTTTTTVYAVATSYAACASANQVVSVGEFFINGFTPDHGYVSGSGVSDAYTTEACCIACTTSDHCAGYAFGLTVDLGCYLFRDNGTCDPAVEAFTFTHYAASGEIAVGNGNCGQGEWIPFVYVTS